MPKDTSHLPLPLRRVVEKSRAGKAAASSKAEKPVSPPPNRQKAAPKRVAAKRKATAGKRARR